jgi:hypothetical protein
MNLFKRLWNRNVAGTAQQLGITVPEMTIPDESVKVEYKWPDCEPIDKTDPYWKLNNNCNCNGVNYHRVEVSPGKWQWQVNEELERLAREREAHRRDLYWALRSRVLTEEEMTEVERYGKYVNIDPNTPYYAEEKERELNAALLQQFQLRATAEASKK